MKRTPLWTPFIACCALSTAFACSEDSGTDDGTDPIMTGPTASVPTPAATPAPTTMEGWAGRTYLLQIPQDNWSYPRDIGSEIGPFVPDFLLRIDSAAAGGMTLTMTTATDAGVQDLCSPTTTVAGTSGAFPGSEIGPVDLPLHVKHAEQMNYPGLQVNATIRALTLTNVLPGTAPAQDGELVTWLDVRDLYPLFKQISDTPTTERVCDTLPTYGVDCLPCPHDDAPYCLEVIAILLGASEVATQIQPVASVTDPACAGASDPGAAAPAAPMQ